jgi:hypothetical protein
MKPTTREEHDDGVRRSFVQALLPRQRQDLSVDSHVFPQQQSRQVLADNYEVAPRQ